MKFVDPTTPYRKSGGMGHPQICCTPAKEHQARPPAVAGERMTEECKALKPVF